MVENSDKRAVFKFLIVAVVVVCFALIFAIVALNMVPRGSSADNGDLYVGNGYLFSEKDFLLEANLSKTVFNVGEEISINATLTNISGKPVNVTYMIYHTPCIYLYDKDGDNHGHVTLEYWQILEANDSMTKNQTYTFDEPGTYVFGVHCDIGANGIQISDKLADITVKIIS